MNTRSILLTGIALALGHWGATAYASAAVEHHAQGIEPIGDAELAGMRGRYTVGNNTVAWFGVQMISTWQDSTGRTLQGTMNLAMDFTHNANLPTVSFIPTVSIVQSAQPTATPDTAAPARSTDSSGLANVSGMVQSVQVAGDGNTASNVARLSVQDGNSAPAALAANGDGRPASATAQSGDATVSVNYTGNTAQVMLSIAGQGAVQQWIRNGSLGQTVTLAADNQYVSNQMEITLIRQAIAANTRLALDVARSIQSTRGLGR
ncbi:MAG: hypothetical protein RSP_26310 [Rhodanobacter sp.]